MKEFFSPFIGRAALENSEFFQVSEPIIYRKRDRNFPSPRAYIEGESSEFF